MSQLTEGDVRRMESESNAAYMYADRLEQEAHELSIAAANARRQADDLSNQFLEAYQEFYGEPYSPPEPKYHEIPGLE